jgi:hypothetical protein
MEQRRILRRPSRYELVGPEGQRFLLETRNGERLWYGPGPHGASLGFELVEHVAAFLQCPWTELTSEEALDVSRD